MKIVYVVFKDPAEIQSLTLKHVEHIKPITCIAVGLLVKETEELVTLAQEITKDVYKVSKDLKYEPTLSNILAIPRSCIKHIEVLKEINILEERKHEE